MIQTENLVKVIEESKNLSQRDFILAVEKAITTMFPYGNIEEIVNREDFDCKEPNNIDELYNIDSEAQNLAGEALYEKCDALERENDGLYPAQRAALVEDFMTKRELSVMYIILKEKKTSPFEFLKNLLSE